MILRSTNPFMRMFLCTSIVICCVYFQAIAQPQVEDQSLTDAQIEELVNQSVGVVDYLDEGWSAERRAILAHPEKAGPILLDHMLSAKSSETLSQAAALLIDMDYDRAQIRDAVRKTFVRIRGSNDKEVAGSDDILRSICRIFGRIGAPEDAKLIWPLIEHSDLYVQIDSLRALAAIGDPEIAERIEQILKKRGQGLSAEEIRKKYYFFREGFEAAEKIRYRALLRSRN